jgi:GDP-L-fucose synthase
MLLWDHQHDAEIVNVGSGSDVSIRELAALVRTATGFRGEIRWDSAQPDGMPRKCLDVSKLRALGFSPLIELEEGIAMTIAEYRQRRLAGTVS